MKTLSRFTLVLTATILTAAVTASAAAPATEDPIDVIRSVVQADRQAVVAEAMRFTDTEAEAFWPAYHRYRGEMNEVGDGIKELVLEYAELYPDVPDDEAKQMLRNLAALEKKQAATRASFLKKAARILPPAKALRFAQIESRLDLALRVELASRIPLVPIEGDLTGTETDAILYQDGVAGGVAVRTRTIRARVAALDTPGRRVTLVDSEGIRQTVTAGPEVVNFDQIRVGDRLKVVATEELVVNLAEPGQATDTAAVGVVDLAPRGAKPGAVAAAVVRSSATIVAIDAEKRTATLRFEDGSTRTLPVRRDIDLGRRKVGEQVVFQATEMIAIGIEKP
jgi:hypothetical protein